MTEFGLSVTADVWIGLLVRFQQRQKLVQSVAHNDCRFIAASLGQSLELHPDVLFPPLPPQC